jgi:hypothetical protein
MEGSQMASKFIVHVEVLFGAIDRLDGLNCKATGQGLQYQKEAKLLCRKIVNFFSLLSRTYEVGKQRLGITQELLSLVTGLAHYLKILIRLALTASLRLVTSFPHISETRIELICLGTRSQRCNCLKHLLRYTLQFADVRSSTSPVSQHNSNIRSLLRMFLHDRRTLLAIRHERVGSTLASKMSKMQSV